VYFVLVHYRPYVYISVAFFVLSLCLYLWRINVVINTGLHRVTFMFFPQRNFAAGRNCSDRRLRRHKDEVADIFLVLLSAVSGDLHRHCHHDVIADTDDK